MVKNKQLVVVWLDNLTEKAGGKLKPIRIFEICLSLLPAVVNDCCATVAAVTRRHKCDSEFSEKGVCLKEKTGVEKQLLAP